MLGVLRRWFRRAERNPVTATGRLLKNTNWWDDYLLADGRRCPDPVRKQILALDPLALLVYIGEGKWMLGLRNGNRRQRLAAQKEYEAEYQMDESKQRATDLQVAQLKVRGIVPVWLYERYEPDAVIVNHFRAMLWVEQNAVREVTRKALAASDWYTTGLPERQRVMLDAVESKGRDAMRYGRRSDGTKRAVNFTFGKGTLT